MQRFWDAVSAAETRDWLARARLVPLRVEGADGRWQDGWGTPDIEERLARAGDAAGGSGSRMRLLNPFDPAIRDRARLQRLFGFEYRNEMFVPPPTGAGAITSIRCWRVCVSSGASRSRPTGARA